VVAILELEEPADGSTIHSVSDALWWAFATVTTVGYGDEYPVTNGGRIVAMILMMVGVALVSVITGWLAKWFLSRPKARPYMTQDGQEPSANEAIAEIRQLIEEHELVYQQTIQDLKDKLVELENRF
jgi:voltage-gated potassium channel